MKRGNVKTHGIKCGPCRGSRKMEAKDIVTEVTGYKPDYPLIGDKNLEISKNLWHAPCKYFG